MIELIKSQVWELLKNKKVSLAMIFDINGKIAWNIGRKIKGNNIHTGEGFSRSFIKNSIKNLKRNKEYIFLKEPLSFTNNADTPSAEFLNMSSDFSA